MLVLPEGIAGWAKCNPSCLYWLVVWNIWVIFPYIGNSNPNWRIHIFQRGRYTTNQYNTEPTRSITLRDSWTWKCLSFRQEPTCRILLSNFGYPLPRWSRDRLECCLWTPTSTGWPASFVRLTDASKPVVPWIICAARNEKFWRGRWRSPLEARVPSGKLTLCYGQWPCISWIYLSKMVIFHSYVSLPEGTSRSSEAAKDLLAWLHGKTCLDVRQENNPSFLG